MKLPSTPPPSSPTRLPVAHAHLDGAAFDVPVDGDMAQRADRAVVEHGLGALPAHDLVEIEIDHGRLAADASLAASMARAPARSLAIGFSANTGLPSSSARMRDLRLQARQRGDRDRVARRGLRPARASRHRPSAYRPRGQVRRCARHRCRQARSPRSGGRRETPAIARCVRNCCRRCPDGSRR